MPRIFQISVFRYNFLGFIFSLPRWYDIIPHSTYCIPLIIINPCIRDSGMVEET